MPIEADDKSNLVSFRQIVVAGETCSITITLINDILTIVALGILFKIY